MPSLINSTIKYALPDESQTIHKDAYQEHLESLNFDVRVVNVLDFKYTNLDILRQKLEQPEAYSALVFGSPRCVHAVVKSVEKIDHRWKNAAVFAVGETTGRIVNERLGLSAEGMGSGHGAALAPIILQRDLQKPVLIPCGNLSRDTIVKLLQDNNVCTDVVQVYETVQHPDLERNLEAVISSFQFSCIVYFSPSGINATLPVLRKFSVPLNDIKIVSIGPTTEKALEELGLNVSAVASKPTPESLASAVASVLI